MRILTGLLALLSCGMILLAGINAWSLGSGEQLARFFEMLFLSFATWTAWVFVIATVSVSRFRPTVKTNGGQISGRVLVGLVVAGMTASVLQLLALRDSGLGAGMQAALKAALIATLAMPLIVVFGREFTKRRGIVAAGYAVLLGGMLVPMSAMLRDLIPGQTEVSPRANELFYPGLLMHDDVRVEIISKPEDLETMSSDWYLNRKEDPVFLDSRLNSYRLTKLSMKGSELSLMVTGPRRIGVTFELKRVSPDGTPETARERLLQCRYLSADRERDAKIREGLGWAVTMREIIGLLSEPVIPAQGEKP